MKFTHKGAEICSVSPVYGIDGKFLRYSLEIKEGLLRSFHVPRSMLGLPQDISENKRPVETISGPLNVIRGKLRGKDG